MAISSGVRAHQAWIEAGGQRWLVLDGSASLNATQSSSTFSASVPMSLDGAEQAFASPDSMDAKIIVSDGGAQETLITGYMDSASFDYIRRVIHVSGRCKSSKLHEGKVNDSWVNKQPGDIIEDVAKSADIDVKVDATTKLKAGRTWDKDWVKMADNVSPSSVISKMCELLGARWWTDADGQLHIADKSSGGSYEVSYQYGVYIVSDALHITVTKNYVASQDIEVTVKSWNQKKKKVIEETSKIPLPPTRPADLGGSVPTPPSRPAGI